MIDQKIDDLHSPTNNCRDLVFVPAWSKSFNNGAAEERSAIAFKKFWRWLRDRTVAQKRFAKRFLGFRCGHNFIAFRAQRVQMISIDQLGSLVG